MAPPRFTLATLTLRRGAIGVALAAAVFGGASGCGADSSSPVAGAVRFDPCAGFAVVPDQELSPAAIVGVGAGIGLWNQAAHARVVMGDGTSGAVEPASLPIHFQAAGAPFHGLYDPAGAQIFINTDLEGHDRVVAVAHEVGHAFGLVHVPLAERRSVMNSGNLDEEPTAADVDALAAIWGACPAGGDSSATSGVR